MSADDSPLAHWEQRYAGDAPTWSGQVNATLAAAVGELRPGRSVDLGCGEGSDVLWLAEHDWDALGLDLSPTAIARARVAATARGVESSARFSQCDLTSWAPTGASFELVTASFFHSQVPLERTEILRRAAGAVAVGGHLVLVSHAAPPPGTEGHHERMLTAREEAERLELPADSWIIEIADQRDREATKPDDQPVLHEDSLLVLRRAA